MAHAEFVHLRVHTAYSLLEGALRIGELVELCAQNRMPAVAITDSGNLFGVMEFAQSCMTGGVQPIIGCALAISREDGKAANGGHRPEPERIVVLAQNDAGYANLSKLSSRAFLETEGGETPQIALDDMADLADGLIVLTGGAEGPLGVALVEGRPKDARQIASRLAAMFPGRVYVELQRHGLAEEAKSEPGLLDIAYEMDLPLVATNECFFPNENTFEAHDALICVADGAYVSQGDRRTLTPEHCFKSADEMKLLFADLPEAFDNALVIAKRCAARPPLRDPILPGYPTEAGRDEAEELRALAEAGLEACLEHHVYADDMDAAAREEAAKPYAARLDFEIGVIADMGFPGYFLIVYDFIKWAKDHDIPVGPGRGSGAGSVVAWALSITGLDPLRFGLLFERFLNPERISMPDFDIDFCQDRRDEVIRYVQERYGHDKVAQIITFGKLQARAVLRDVGRVLEMPYGQVDRICKMVPNNPANPVTLSQAIAKEERLQAERDGDETVARLLRVGLKLEGLYRHASTHAAGVVIGDRPLDELAPLYRDPKSDMPVTQFSMKYVESTGLVKFDFLGLKTLTVINRAVKLIAMRGIEIDISALPLDDEATYWMLARGETVGVFQFESRGMQDLLRNSEPSNIEDLIALVALFRPGPMENIPKYIACKLGREQPEELHPSIEPVVRDTYGVIIYQEQVMQIAQVLSGYSLGDADLLRRAMGKKIKSEMDDQREIFVKGAVERGVEHHRANFIFDLVAKFAGYGFNKSHAACYALVAYQTAWLKANYPTEFLAASMTLDLTNTDKLGVFKGEIKRLGIEIRPPDINRSQTEFSVEEVSEDSLGGVRYALAAIKNVGRAAMDSVVAERQANGPFKSPYEFAGRLEAGTVNKRQIENLARAGAFDGIDGNRRRITEAAEKLVRYAQSAAQERASGQENLFGGDDKAVHEPVLPDGADWLPTERLKNEADAIGFYLSAHPLDDYEKVLRRLGTFTYADLLGSLNGEAKKARLAGNVVVKQERTSSRGNRFAFVQFTDPSGDFEAVMFAETLSAAGELLETGNNVVLDVEARLEDETPRVTVLKVYSLEKMAADTASRLELHLTEDTALAEIKRIIGETKRGKGKIALKLHLAGGLKEVSVDLKGGYAITPPVREAIGATPGIAEIVDL